MKTILIILERGGGGTPAVFPLHPHSPGSGLHPPAARQGVQLLLLGFCPCLSAEYSHLVSAANLNQIDDETSILETQTSFAGTTCPMDKTAA